MPRKNVSDAWPAIPDWTCADAALSVVHTLNAAIARREAEKTTALAALLEAHDANIKPLLTQRDALGAALKEFAETHRVDFRGAQSRRLNHGVLEFRLGQRALKLLARWTWEKILGILQERKKRDWIRVREEVDRAAILAADLSPDELRNFGLRVDQEERFYYFTFAAETVNPEAAA